MITEHKQRITRFFEEPKGWIARTVQIAIVALILFSGAAYVVEYFFTDYYSIYSNEFLVLEWITIGVFIVEYFVRLWASPSRSKFIFSFYGMIDFLAVFPSLVVGFNGLPIRLLRLIRLLQLSRIFRSTRLTRLFQDDAYTMSRIMQENIVKNMLVIVGLLYAFKPIQYLVENLSAEALSDTLLATSILAVAAMFGFFSISYADTDPNKIANRVFMHLTTAVLLLPIGLAFIIIQQTLTREIGTYPLVMLATTWCVYAGIVLWDFANVRRLEEKLNINIQ